MQMTLSNSNKSSNLLLSIFIILTLLICVGGYTLYHYQKRNITQEKHNELSAISKLKVDQIVNWRKERLDNARSIYNNQAIITHISEYIQGVDNHANYLTITKWIKAILDEPDYSTALLIDPSGKIILNTNQAKPITETSKLIVEQAKQSKEIVFSDLYKYGDKDVFIDVAIPLYLNPEIKEGFTGVVFLRIDPEKYFYPVILSWPTPSASSEIMLIRREGDKVLYLSELQHKKNTALSKSKPLTDSDILAVKAITGKTGIFEGVDYRGIKVMGAAQPVPGSQWMVVSKIDMDEIYHPIFAKAIWIFIITFLLILSAALNIWTRQLKKSDRARKLADEKLRTTEDGFRTLAESMPQFVWIAQADGMINYFNHQWAEHTGLTLKDSYGMGWSTSLHPNDKQCALDAWQQAIETGKNYDIECRLRQKNGVYHWFIIRGVPLRDNSGKITNWYGTCTDIDSQKQIENEIKTLNEELERRVDVRTTQLQTANKELEAFSYAVSHDLRAPLHNIDGWSMTLLEHSYDQLDTQGRQYLDRVRSEAQRMRNLIDALLKLSRVSRPELNKSSVNLTILAHDITNRLLGPTDRQLEINIQPGMFTFGDPVLLEIALTNLLDNAYKFTGKQPLAQIEFGQSVIDEKQTFWIRDNGAGFDMAYSQKLFGAFQRMHKQTDFPGTGIGLATVQRIINRHEGHIWAESKINQGTTFYFTIPEAII